MGNWLYELKQSKDGAKLVEAYKEVDEILQNSLGTADNETDFIIYLEDNYSVSFGVLLIKMSQAMVDSALDNPKKDLLNFWSRKIVEEQYQLKNNAFRASANDLHNAFLTELSINGKRKSGKLGKSATEDIHTLFQGFSDRFRSLKFTREEYDPTLKSDKYLLKNYNKAFNLFDKSLDFAISSLQIFKERLVSAKIFVRTSEYFDGRFFDLMLQFTEAYILFFLRLKKFLQTIQKISTVGFAFLCGAINGIIEFLAGIIDVVFLIIEGIIYGIFESNDEIKLDYLSLREALENFAEKLIKEPDFLVKAVQSAVNGYVDKRYGDEELTDYEVAYFAGEDVVIVIDVIVSIIFIIKGTAYLASKFPKFAHWIDSVFSKLPKKAKDTLRKIVGNRVVRYSQKYVGQKLRPLITANLALLRYGKAGKLVVEAVDNQVKLSVNTLSKKKRSKQVMISGMIYQKGNKISKPYTNYNFLKDEIGIYNEKTNLFLTSDEKKSLFQKFLDEMHPTLKERYNIHIDEWKNKGLKAPDDDIIRLLGEFSGVR